MQETEVSTVARMCTLSGVQQERCLADSVLCSQHSEQAAAFLRVQQAASCVRPGGGHPIQRAGIGM